jgi:hypothetical protein
MIRGVLADVSCQRAVSQPEIGLTDSLSCSGHCKIPRNHAFTIIGQCRHEVVGDESYKGSGI